MLLPAVHLPCQGLTDARVTLVGRVSRIEDAGEAEAAVQAYRAARPDSFWTDFGDFGMHRMHEIKSARVVGGFARAGQARG